MNEDLRIILRFPIYVVGWIVVSSNKVGAQEEQVWRKIKTLN